MICWKYNGHEVAKKIGAVDGGWGRADQTGPPAPESQYDSGGKRATGSSLTVTRIEKGVSTWLSAFISECSMRFNWTIISCCLSRRMHWERPCRIWTVKNGSILIKKNKSWNDSMCLPILIGWKPPGWKENWIPNPFAVWTVMQTSILHEWSLCRLQYEGLLNC